MTNETREALKNLGSEIDAAIKTVMLGLELTMVAARQVQEALEHAQRTLEADPDQPPLSPM